MVINVLEYLETSAQKFPDKVFLSDEEKFIKFSEAVDIAKRIGSYLTNHVSDRNNPIGVFIGRNVESVLMFFGVVYSGNFGVFQKYSK